MPYSTYQIFLNIYNESKKRKELEKQLNKSEQEKSKKTNNKSGFISNNTFTKSLLINDNILPISD